MLGLAMTSANDFASMMEAMAGNSPRISRKLRAGERVSGKIVQIGADSIFVDVGSMSDARIPKAELIDKDGELTLKIGDTLEASVAKGGEYPILTVALGRGSSAVNLSQIQSAFDGQLPIEGVVSKEVKGGLEVTVGGVRAFCPASQIELGFTKELPPFVGQTFTFVVTEFAESGRKIIVSRKSLLEKERKDAAQDLLSRLTVGEEVDGTVSSVQKYGAFVDIGGVEGLMHISELTAGRVAQVQDIVSVGDKVRVQILGIDSCAKGVKISLSMKSSEEAQTTSARSSKDEIYDGEITGHVASGLLVQTSQGTAILPLRETALSPGQDQRRAYPVGTQVRVVMTSNNGGKISFSMLRVEKVEERNQYAEFSKGRGKGPSSDSGRKMGTFGDLLQGSLGANFLKK